MLSDREVVKISVGGAMAVERHETYANTEEVAISPEPFPHWTLKGCVLLWLVCLFWLICCFAEINEQPAAIMRALNFGGRIMGPASVKLGGLEEHREVLLCCSCLLGCCCFLFVSFFLLQTLLAIDHLVIAACGTSFHSGMFGARVMRLLRAFKTVSVVDAAEMEPMDMPQSAKVNNELIVEQCEHVICLSDLVVCCKGGLLVISQSGETKDVMRALQLALERDVPCMSVVNAVGSSVARASR